jgi:hypothetical protein
MEVPGSSTRFPVTASGRVPSHHSSVPGPWSILGPCVLMVRPCVLAAGTLRVAYGRLVLPLLRVIQLFSSFVLGSDSCSRFFPRSQFAATAAHLADGQSRVCGWGRRRPRAGRVSALTTDSTGSSSTGFRRAGHRADILREDWPAENPGYKFAVCSGAAPRSALPGGKFERQVWKLRGGAGTLQGRTVIPAPGPSLGAPTQA